MALTNSDLQALRAFSRVPEGRLWVAMLEKKLAEADAHLRTATGEDLYRKQGRAQQLEELLSEIKSADQVLRRQEVSRQARSLHPTQS